MKDLRLRHHRRTDRTDLATVLHFIRTDLATVMVFVEAHEKAVLAALVTGSDWHSTFGLPAVREITPVLQEGHSAALTGPSTPRLIYASTVNELIQKHIIKRSLFSIQMK